MTSTNKQKFFGDTATEFFAIGVALVVVGSICAGIAVVGWQIFDWLKTGTWLPVSVGTTFEYFAIARPQTTWVGLQTVFDYLLAFPLAGALPIAGVVFFLLMLQLANAIGTR